jgi:polysaccharide pyruvyl transferase WcaK-like protein
VAEPNTLEELLPTLEVPAVAVTSRLHSTILAHAMGVPTVAVSFDPKVTNYMKQAGQADMVIDIRGVSAAALGARLDLLRTDVADRSQLIAQTCASFRSRLQEQYDDLSSQLGYGTGTPSAPLATHR